MKKTIFLFVLLALAAARLSAACTMVVGQNWTAYSVCFPGHVTVHGPANIMTGGSPCSGSTVKVELQKYSNGAYITQATEFVTAADGQYSFNVSSSGQWRIIASVYASGPDCGACSSNTIQHQPVTITIKFPLAPVFTAQSTYCSNDPVTLTGATDGGGGTAEYYLWEVATCDANGDNVGTTPVYSMWFTGAPGSTFTLPNTSAYACNQYYRVKLATTNACSSWAETTHVIYLRCAPTPTITSSEANPVCYSKTVTLATNYTPSQTTTILWNTGATTSSVIVNPTAVSTPYSVTVTAKGCDATANYTVTRSAASNPAFTLGGTTSGSGYFNLTATPVFSNPQANGVWAYWDVAKVNSSGSYTDVPNTKVYNPDCWFTANGICTFLGYNYTTSYTTGNNGQPSGTSFSCSATPGRFENNKIYRISRAVSTSACPDMFFEVKWISMCSPCRTPDGSGMIVLDSKQYDSNSLPEELAYLRDLRPTAGAAPAALEVFPNPSTGIFSLSFGSTGDRQIQVYDLMGKLVAEQQTSLPTAELDLRNQIKGVYLCKVLTGDQTETRRIVIE